MRLMKSGGFICVKAIILVVGLVVNTGPVAGGQTDEDLSTSRINDTERAHRAAMQLVRSQLPSGFFPYDFDFATGNVTDMERMEAPNLVRQAGAAFALGEYLAGFGDVSVQTSLKAFLQRAEMNSVPVGKGFIQGKFESWGLYSRWKIRKYGRGPMNALGLLYSTAGDGRLVTVDGDYELAWPGATALSLIAALKYREISGDDRFDNVIRQWRDGLLALHVPERGVREAPHYLSESAYVNGEAWLALAEHHRVFPEDAVTRGALTMLDDYMIRHYTDRPTSMFYHWGTMAAAVRADDSGDDRFEDFLYLLSSNFLEEQGARPLWDGNTCGPVEGLATFIGYQRRQGLENDPLVLRAMDYLARAMRNNRLLQLDKGAVRLSSIRPEFARELEAHQGAFILSRQAPLTRIDITQHCLNAILRMRTAGIAQ